MPNVTKWSVFQNLVTYYIATYSYYSQNYKAQAYVRHVMPHGHESSVYRDDNSIWYSLCTCMVLGPGGLLTH